jgi:hypothetical protein
MSLYELLQSDWTSGPNDQFAEANNQVSLLNSRFGEAGTFFRFFTQAPELDPNTPNTGWGKGSLISDY